MEIRDPVFLAAILQRHGSHVGKAIDCFGTLEDRADFIYFKVFEDRLELEMHRVLVEVASFRFRFTLRLAGAVVELERTVCEVEGGNKRIRAVLGEAYAKTSIGLPFRELSEEEGRWVEVALRTFREHWMKTGA
jgi:hypothetical protein